MNIQNFNFVNFYPPPTIQLPQNHLIEQLIKRNDEKDEAQLDQLLSKYRGEYEPLLLMALDGKNYRAVNLLINHGASLYLPLPSQIDLDLKEKFKLNFFKNKYYYGVEGETFFEETYKKRCRDLAYAIAAHYYPQDSEALSILQEHPEYITLDVLVVFIEAGDTAAFNKLMPLFLNSPYAEPKKSILLLTTMRDFNFSLMGFNYDYILPRLEILKSILALDPDIRTLDKNLMSSFEIAQYLKMFLPSNASPEFEVVLSKVMEDPVGYHEIRGIQRLLINNLASKLVGGVAHYPSVAQHFKVSISRFLQQNNIPNEWIFITPSPEFTVEKCIQLIEKKQILKFFTGWSGGDDTGHAINVVIYDHYLCVCNRGAGSTSTTLGVCIYDIQDKSSLKKIISLFLERSKANEQFITKDLLNHPQIKFLKQIFQHSQEVGNCVWLSEKIGFLPCFIASYLKQGHSLEKAIIWGKNIYKQWSQLDRISLFKAYLDHHYHYRDALQNESEGILLREIFLEILKMAPNQKSKEGYCDLMWQKLTDEKFKKFMDKSVYSQLLIQVQFTKIEIELKKEDDTLAWSFLNQLSDVNIKNQNGETLLHLACRHGALKLAEELLRMGANSNLVANGKTPLELIFIRRYNPYCEILDQNSYEQLTKVLMADTDLDAAAKQGSFPFFILIKNGDEAAVDQLLNKGIDLSLSDKKGYTAFHYAAMSSSETIGKQILSVCPNLEIKTSLGKTPLYLAVQHNVLHAVKFLLETGANPNTVDIFKIKPLTVITSDFQLEVCKLLIDYGANINELDDFDYTPLMSHLFFKNNRVVDLLLQNKKIDLNYCDKKGNSALSIAVKNTNISIIKLLLKRGIKPNKTALKKAAKSKQTEIYTLLQEANVFPFKWVRL